LETDQTFFFPPRRAIAQTANGIAIEQMLAAAPLA
jgi:hypothetical protein